MPSSRGFSQPRSPALQTDSLQTDSLLSEPPGKPKNIGVGSLSLLQGNLPNPGVEPGSPAFQEDSLPAEPQGKPRGYCQFSSVQSLSRVWLFATPWIAARQASLSITNSRSLLKLMPIESVMPSSHLFLLSSPPPVSNPSQHQGLFQWVNSLHEVRG